MINYGGSLNKQVHAGEGREGRDSPCSPACRQDGWGGCGAGSRLGLTVMRNEKSAEKLMAPADCAGWHTAGGPLQPARYANAGAGARGKGGRKAGRHKGEKCK